MPALAHFNHGTQRLVSPEETLARITPALERQGITRCMPVTGLDSLGIATYCAIRPNALVLQVSNGKGVTDAAARVSALMEAIELTHAEHPRAAVLRRTSLATLETEGATVLRPHEIHGARDVYFTDRFICEWVAGDNLVDGSRIWAPASAVYFSRTPCLHDTSTNGLASGNGLSEATLHAIYELIERDAMSSLSVDGTIRIRDRAQVIDPATIDDAELRAMLDRVDAAGTRVLLLWLPSAIPVHTFWAVMLNRSPMAPASTLNVGWGTHVDCRIAASRALTEAAQSRLVFIHGAREDIMTKPVYRAERTVDSAGVRYFAALEPTVVWRTVADICTVPCDADLDVQLRRIVDELAQAGHDRLVRFDLTDPDTGIPVVKVIAPSLTFNPGLF
jgi:ribosomal protein S12 methylthiotransferase accessory factor